MGLGLFRMFSGASGFGVSFSLFGFGVFFLVWRYVNMIHVEVREDMTLSDTFYDGIQFLPHFTLFYVFAVSSLFISPAQRFGVWLNPLSLWYFSLRFYKKKRRDLADRRRESTDIFSFTNDTFKIGQKAL